ncbi:MAG TPA: MBL fold metallo-hydrolase [Opitutaceae bacterium]|nr:MBL fold metallo-hydrolase [Opitutaceae bacterium]
MRFCILGSGSSGNSALVVTEGARILLDAGFSARRLGAMLARAGESIERIDAVFVTHEHSDHSSGIESLKKFPDLKFFANAATARAIQKELSWSPHWRIFATGSSFQYRDLIVESFAIPHDAQDPVGYRFTSGLDGDLFSPQRTLAWVTDLGHVPKSVRDRIRESDVIVVEANHCPRMLEADPRRSWTLKRRIGGRHGHLSNERMSEVLSSVASPRWRRVYLAHLSRDCNSRDAVERALAAVRSVLPCEFSIVGHGEGTPFYEIA